MSVKFHEHEELDKMKTNIREAIQASKELAIKSRGNPYKRLIDALHNIEGSCRVMAAHRGDATWLPIGIQVAECHKRAGGWLRGHFEHGVYIIQSPGQLNQNFVKLAAILSIMLEGVERKYTAKTGMNGPVLPARPAEERRMGRPAFQQQRKGGLILPPKYRTA